MRNTAGDYGSITPAILVALERICGADAVLHGAAAPMTKYAHDQVTDRRYGHEPDVVVLPAHADQAAAVISLAAAHRLPVTPRGAGSGLSGGAVPIHGGICLACERMNRIIEIDTDSLVAVVEPGVVTNALDAALATHGLFFAGYPMSEEFCMIGGNVAENAGGGRAIKYGVVSRYIIGLEVVTPQGQVVQLGGKRVKDVTGYDLVKLFCGSEGTLGFITKVFIQLLPRPRHRISSLVLFNDVDSAIGVVPAIMTGGGFLPTSIEFMDRTSMVETCRALKETIDYEQAGAMMLFEVDGSFEAEVAANAAYIKQTCEAHGARRIYPGHEPGQSERFWRIRKRVPWVINRLASHTSVEDIVVPIAAIPELIRRLPALEAQYAVRIPVFGHAGDGNLHAVPAAGAEADDTWDTLLPALLTDLYRITAELGGTISGEHGIGHKRKRYVDALCDPVYLDLMRKIKQAWDPLNIMNPGKIFSFTENEA